MVSLTNPMRVAITGVSLLLCMFATFYFLAILKMELVYVHLFYVPLVLVSVWWHRKGVILTFYIALFLLICNFYFAPDISIVRNLERAAIFLFVSILTSTMFESRKKMEKQLEEYAEHLEEKVQERTRELKETHERLLKSERLVAIGEVANMVGHDLRNPLQSIENATYYLNNELPRLPPSTPIPQKAIEMLQVINDSVNYADKIIRDLHDFSATKKPALKKTNINAIVKETLSQVKAPENVELILELRHLPKINVGKGMIKRVFLNLAINGIQAMENGGTLKVSTKKTKGFVEVSFKDTGVGASKENMRKLFTPFFTTKAKGMGMGLSICKKFVDAHGGSIEVESEEGKGTTFTVKLPIQRENGGEKT